MASRVSSTGLRLHTIKGGKRWKQAFQKFLGEEAKRVAAFGADGRGAKQNDGESRLTLPSQQLAVEAAASDLGGASEQQEGTTTEETEAV